MKDRIPRKLKKKRYQNPETFIKSLQTKLRNAARAAEYAAKEIAALQQTMENQSAQIRKMVAKLIEHKQRIQKLGGDPR